MGRKKGGPMGRPNKHVTDSAKKRAKQETTRRRDLTRIFLLDAHQGWIKLRDELGHTDTQLATLLLDRYHEPSAVPELRAPLHTSTPIGKAFSVISGVEPLDAASFRSDIRYDDMHQSTDQYDIDQAQGDEEEEEEEEGEEDEEECEEEENDEDEEEEDEYIDEDEFKDVSMYIPSDLSIAEHAAEMTENKKFFEFEDLEAVSDESLVHDIGSTTQPTLPAEDNPQQLTSLDAVSENACIAYESSLLQLAALDVSKCEKCGKGLMLEVQRHGTAFVFQWKCCEGHTLKWVSQPPLPKKGALLGDFMLCTNILLSGNNYTKIALMLKFMNLQPPSSATFDRLQASCMNPAINKYWEEYREELQSIYKDCSIVVAGDGRLDSPGYSAKYLTYTLMEHDSNAILDLQVVDKRLVGGKSPNLEKEGLIKCLSALKESGLKVDELVTDAHRQIAAYMRKEEPDICHQWDVWHASKNLTKHLNNIASKHPALQLWVKYIIRHFWYACEQAAGDPNKLLSIWRTVVHHTAGRHSWVLDDGFGIFQCAHGDLEENPDHPYLEPQSPAHVALCSFVYNARFFKSVAHHYANFRHTGNLEVFHHHILMYASKRFAFGHPAFKARCLLAAIDYNKHRSRAARKNKAGEVMYGRIFNKRSATWSAVLLKEPKEYLYIRDLQQRILSTRLEMTKPLQAKRELEADDGRRISRNIARVPAPDTSTLAAEKITRFSTSSTATSLSAILLATSH